MAANEKEFHRLIDDKPVFMAVNNVMHPWHSRIAIFMGINRQHGVARMLFTDHHQENIPFIDLAMVNIEDTFEREPEMIDTIVEVGHAIQKLRFEDNLAASMNLPAKNEKAINEMQVILDTCRWAHSLARDARFLLFYDVGHLSEPREIDCPALPFIQIMKRAPGCLFVNHELN